MKMRAVLILISIFLLNSLQLVYTQDCFEFYKNCEAFNGKIYQYDEHTSSFYLDIDNPIEIQIEALSGIDYLISLCTDSITYPLKLVISDLENIVLYDNSSEGYISKFEFSVKERSDLKIKVSLSEKNVTNSSNTYGCVGVIIKKTIKPRTGF